MVLQTLLYRILVSKYFFLSDVATFSFPLLAGIFAAISLRVLSAPAAIFLKPWPKAP